MTIMEFSKLLKSTASHLAPFPGRSDILVKTRVPSGLHPRGLYLEDPTSVPGPLISCSAFVPSYLTEHLMRRKKNGALGVKFKSLSGTDEITNMEGALHTFVTPICLSFLHGDYRYNNGHGVVRFPEVESESGGEKIQQARQVIISASVQPDFEGKEVMLPVCAIGESAFEGNLLPANFKILGVESKQDKQKRNAYDTILRAHMIYHLTVAHRLPSLSKVSSNVIGVPSAISCLEEQIEAEKTDYSAICGIYVRLPNRATISVEVLFNCALQQIRNEISALEAVCPQGYVLTIDPPSIFAQQIGAILLNRIQFTALKWLAGGGSIFANMKVFAFNDYADRSAIKCLKAALGNQGHVQVVPKEQLFPDRDGLYRALPGTEGSLLVVHNNSGTLFFYQRRILAIPINSQATIRANRRYLSTNKQSCLPPYFVALFPTSLW